MDQSKPAGRWKRHLLSAMFVIVLAAVSVSPIRQSYMSPKGFIDFSVSHTTAQCLVDACNPYDSNALNVEMEQREEVKPLVNPDIPVYPPSTLLLMAPWAAVAWPAAGVAWSCFVLLILSLGCVALIELLEMEKYPAAIFMLAAFLAGNGLTTALIVGNPSLFTTATGLLAAVLMVRGTGFAKQFGWIAMGCALGMKPQIVLGLVLVLLWNRATRRDAANAVGLAIVLLAAGCAAYGYRLGSLHFLADLVTNNVQAISPGHVNDSNPARGSSFLNLERLYWDIPRIHHPWPRVLGWVTTAVLAAAACFAQIRGGRLRQLLWTSLAFATLLCCLPIYHRKYDRVLFLLLIPAVMELAALGRRTQMWVFATAAIFWEMSPIIFRHVLGRFSAAPVAPLVELFLCGVVLWVMWSERPAEDAAAPTLNAA